MAKKQVKILYIITQGELGGAQKYVHDLACNLPEEFTPVVAMGREKTDLGDELKRKGVRVVYLKNLVRNIHPLRELPALLEIRKLIKSEKPDIVHLNSTKAGVLGSVAAWLARNKNVIFTAHGLAFLEPKPWPIKQLYYWAEKFATVFRKQVIAVSEFDRQQAIKQRLGSQDKFITINNGIDLDNLNSLPKQEARAFFDDKCASHGKVLVGTLANLYKTKGLSYLINAAVDVKKHNPKAAFAVIGFGSQESALNHLIKKYNLQNSVYLLGQVKNAEQYLSGLDLFVLPSVKEGFPYSLLYAAAAGLPIVATNVGGVPEIIKDEESGILIPPKRAGALAKAINRMLDDPALRQSLGEGARKSAKKFTIQRMVNQTVEIYDRLLGLS